MIKKTYEPQKGNELLRKNHFQTTLIKIVLIFSTCATVSCDPGTNPLALTIPDSYKESFHYYYSKGRALYDSGEYDEALENAEKAWKLKPNSEKAAALLGFCQLAKAGVTPFDLAGKMIETNKPECPTEDEVQSSDAQNQGTEETSEATEDCVPAENQESTTEPSTTEEQSAEESDSSDSKSSNTGDTLAKISEAIGLTEEEIRKLGTVDETDPALPVLIPECAAKARTGDLSQRLEYVNKAIAIICPFVDKSLRLEDDYRHVCTQVDFERVAAGKSHFLWAFAHLTEALAFNAVLNFGKVGKGKTNLEQRVDKVKDKKVETPEEIDAFLSEFETIQQTVDRVMPTSGLCSEETPQTQLQGLLNDLITVSATFEALPGIPKSITASLTSATAGVLEAQDNLGEGGGGQTASLKGDLNSKITKSLGEKLDQLNNENVPFTPEQTQTLCDGLSSISGGNEEDKPALCL